MVRAWVELQRRKRDARHKVSGALGRMRQRELSSALLQWLAYADDQARAPSLSSEQPTRKGRDAARGRLYDDDDGDAPLLGARRVCAF